MMNVAMHIRSFLAGAGILLMAGCVTDIVLPRPGNDHPANPNAPAAPAMPPPQALSDPEPANIHGRSKPAMRRMDRGVAQDMKDAEGGQHDH